MSRRNLRSPRLDLQLNLSPPQQRAPEADNDSDGAGGGGGGSLSSSPTSCVTSDGRRPSGSPKAERPPAMVIGACTRCLMYCMVARQDFPSCLNCKQPCLVDLLDEDKKRGRRA